MMKIILKEDVPHLGVIGELVRVRDGYGRNFLIPQGKAVLASARSEHELAHQKRLAAHSRDKAKAGAEVDKVKIEQMMIVLRARVAQQLGEQTDETLQKLFGSITARDIAKVIDATGIALDHRRVTLSEKIHTVGKYSAKIRLDGAVVAQVPFWVIPESATDVDVEKKRVEAAQAAARKAEEDRIAEEKAKHLAASQIKIERPADTFEVSEQEGEDEASDGDKKGKKAKKG